MQYLKTSRCKNTRIQDVKLPKKYAFKTSSCQKSMDSKRQDAKNVKISKCQGAKKRKDFKMSSCKKCKNSKRQGS